MKRYVTIKKINLNESRAVLTEADPNNVNKTNNVDGSITYTTKSNNELDSYTKKWIGIMDSLLPFLDPNNNIYGDLTLNNKQKIDSLLQSALTPDQQYSKLIKDLENLITELKKIKVDATDPNNNLSIKLKAVVQKDKEILNLIDQNNNNKLFASTIYKNEVLNDWVSLVRECIKVYDDGLVNANKDDFTSDLINTLSKKVGAPNNITNPEAIVYVINVLQGKETGGKKSKFGDKLFNALKDAVGDTSAIKAPVATELQNKIETFRTVLAKIHRSFDTKAVTEPAETMQRIKMFFDTPASATTENKTDMVLSLLHRELFGSAIRGSNADNNYNQTAITNDYYKWAEDKTNGAKFVKLVDTLLTNVNTIINNYKNLKFVITTVDDLTKLTKELQKIIDWYYTDATTDNWSVTICNIKKILIKALANGTDLVDKDKDNTETTTSTDWKALLDEAEKNHDDEKLKQIWNDYYDTEWGTKSGKYIQEVCDQVKLLGKPFTNELLTLGFTENLNPFITYIKNHIEFLLDGLLTEKKYAAIHNAYINKWINKDALKGIDIKTTDDKLANIINSKNLFSYSAGVIVEYLDQQGRVFGAYSQTPQFSSNNLKNCYIDNEGNFIADLFYEPGDPEKFADFAEQIGDSSTRSTNKGSGDTAGTLKSLTIIKEQIKACLSNKSLDSDSGTKYQADAKTLINKVRDPEQFIAYLYISKGSPQKAIDIIKQYKSKDGQPLDDKIKTFNTANSQVYAKLIKSLNIDENNVAELINNIITELKLEKK